MRIATNYVQQQSVDMMLRKQSELAQTQQQVSTGERILTPSDDPVAAVRILGLERDISLAAQYLNNAKVAENKLSVAEGVFDSAENIIQRIRELAVKGLNETSGESRTAIADEIKELNSALVGLANTTDANGEYLFSGYQSNTQAFDETTYAYNGDSGQRHIRVGGSYLVAVSEPGDQIFVSTNQDGTTQSIFQTINEFATALASGTTDTAPNDSTFLANLDKGMDKVALARTRVGTQMNSVDHQKTVNEASTASMQTHLSQLKDLDYSEAITRLTSQFVGLQAAQQAYVKVQGLSLFNYI